MNELATDDKSKDDAGTDDNDENYTNYYFGHLFHWERVTSSNKVGKGFAGKHRIHRVVRLHWPEQQINDLWKQMIRKKSLDLSSCILQILRQL